MNHPERLFYQRFKRSQPTWFLQRLEDSIQSGIPDVLCVPKGESMCMLEFKALPATNVQLRASQVSWITEFALKGGLVWVINHCPKTNTVSAWKAPFPIVKGRAKHGKIDCEPTLRITDLKKLKPHHLSKPSRRLV
jgi:Holliday junction resolvase